MDLTKEPCWAIVELFGHIRHAGRVQQDELFGQVMGRVDVPDAKDPNAWHATHLFAGSAVFRFTPCSEEYARKVAAQDQGVWTSYQLPARSDEESAAEDEALRDESDEELEERTPI